jgi:hypothetical protein
MSPSSQVGRRLGVRYGLANAKDIEVSVIIIPVLDVSTFS